MEEVVVGRRKRGVVVVMGVGQGGGGHVGEEGEVLEGEEGQHGPHTIRHHHGEK